MSADNVFQRRLSMDSQALQSSISSDTLNSQASPSVRGSQSPIIRDGRSESNRPHGNNEISSSGEIIYRVSKRRWAILFAISMFGFTSSLVDSTSSILREMLALLEFPLEKYIYTGLVFAYLPIATTVPTGWLIDKYGIRFSLYAATFLMLLRNGFRALLFDSNLPNWQEFKIVYWFLSNLCGMQTLVTFFCLPLKVSETWFAPQERSIAWTVILSSTYVGSSIAAFAYPRIVHTVKDTLPLAYLNIAAAIITALTVLICVTKSKPKFPPSERNFISTNKEGESYLVTLKRIIYHKDMMIHILHEAFYEGVLIAVLSVQQDILIASGHSEIFIGNLMSINSILDIILLVALSTFVNNIKDTVLTCKLGSLTRTIFFVVYLVCLLYPVGDTVCLLASLVYSVSKSWAMPNFNNMTAHLASGNVSEATASSFQITLTILIISLNQVAFMKFIRYNGNKPDYTFAMLFSAVGAVACSLTYLIFFKGKLSKRVRESNNGSNIVDSTQVNA